MHVLLSATAHDRFWPRVARSGVAPVVLCDDGRLSLADGSAACLDEVRPEVAWGTSDVFPDLAKRRRFFDLLRRARSLEWYQSFAAGFDGPVYRDLAARGVRVTNAHVNDIPIAEFVLRAVLDHFQRAEAWRAAAAERRWEPHDYREVHGSTWLVVGLGSVGTAVARRARAFGATVIGCRRHPSPDDPADRVVTPDRLGDVAGEADVVVLAAPANDATNGLVGEAFLAAMKQGSVLVNVARGTLVDDRALLAALDRGVPEVAVLDVFATEPLPGDHPYWHHPAVVLTPHNAAGGTGRYERQAVLFRENLDRFLAGEPLRNDVTEEILGLVEGA